MHALVLGGFPRAEQAQDAVRGGAQKPDEGIGGGREHHQGPGEPPAHLFGMEQGQAFRGQLAENDVQEGDEDERDGHGHRVRGDDVERRPQGSKKRREHIRDRRLPDPAQPEAGQRDAELGTGDGTVDGLKRLLHRAGARVSIGDHGVDAGPPRSDQREFGSDEERVREDERQNGSQTEAEGGEQGFRHTGRQSYMFSHMAAPTALPIDATCVHHAPHRHESARRMGWVLGITAAVMVAEAVGGWASHSLALLADAGHMLADVASLGLAVVVARLAQRPATAERTYGLLRLEVFAAFINGAVLLVIAVGIGVEAFRRFSAPPAIHAGILLIIAGVGLAANLVSARILHHGHDHSLNQRGAYLHVLSDLLGSVGAILAGLVVLTTGWTLADPIISVGIGLLIVNGSWRLVRESVDVLLEATPAHISLSDVHDQIASLPGVTSVHDLHVWTVTSGVVAMSGHLLVQNPADNQRVLEAVQERMEKLKIRHVTVQMEKDPTCE